MSLNFCPNSFQHVRTGASFEFQARLATLVYLNSITVQFFDSQAQTADHLFLQSFLSSTSAWNVKVTPESSLFFLYDPSHSLSPPETYYKLRKTFRQPWTRYLRSRLKRFRRFRI